MFSAGNEGDVEMGIICRRGKSQCRLLSFVFLSIFGLISLKLFLHANIALPSLKDTSRSLDFAGESPREYHAISLGVPKIIIHNKVPSADDDLGIAKNIKISENRFHYKPHKKKNFAPPTTATIRSLVEGTTEFDRLPVTSTARPKTKKRISSRQDQRKVGKKPDGSSGLLLPPKKKLPQKNTSNYIRSLPQKKTMTPRRYFKDRKAYERYKKYLTEQEPPLPEQENAVIIITNHRSGSTFFGELFNQHPDAFSLFEPLFPTSNRSECDKNRGLKVELLKDFIRCRLPDWDKVYKGMPPADRITGNENMKMCLATGMCFRAHTKELCEDRHCPRTNDTSVKQCTYDCGKVNLRLAENECRKKKTVVAKLIRFCDILDLESIMKDSESNVKVLHLLRDPRGIANSRHMLERKLNLKDSLNRTCKRQAHNLLVATNEMPEWLEGKYMAVRYEDTALFPYETAQSVYDFVGLSFPLSMKEWIAKNTAIPIPTDGTIDDNSERDVGGGHYKIPERVKRVDPYSTKRNATATVQKWAKRLPYATVKQVESVCSNMMKMAGYIEVGSPEQYYKSNRMFFEDKIPIFDSREGA